MKIYCISGLAADHRLFKNLTVQGCELVALPWLPFSEADTMATYAAKMAAAIPDPKPVIIGLSFGGMLAVEMARMHPAWTVFVVSGAKTSAELGYDSAFLRFLSRTKIVPSSLFNRPNPIVLNNLGAKTAEERQLLSAVISDSDGHFMKWATGALLHWNNTTYPSNITHIHGTDDHVIRSANVHPDYLIRGGTHIMILNHSAEVGKIISDCLRERVNLQ